MSLISASNRDGISADLFVLKDRLGGTLNNLRFSDATQEEKLFRNSGFYTNRIRFGEMLDPFKRAGFECHLPRVIRWETLPTPRGKSKCIAHEVPEKGVLVSGFDVVLRRQG